MNEQKEQNVQEEKKGKGLFYLVIASAIVIVAIVGATYAYFTTNIATNEGEVEVGSSTTTITLDKQDDSYSPGNIIPATNVIAQYGFENQTTISYTCSKTENSTTTQVTVTESDYNAATDPETAAESADPTIDYTSCVRVANSRCVDDNGDPVCGYYHFKLNNSNETTQTIDSIKFRTVSNNFTNLVFAIYGVDSTNGNLVRVTDVTPVPADDTTTLSTNPASGETQIALVSGTNAVLAQTFNNVNAAEYYLVTWLQENNSIQNETDGNKLFNGTIEVNIVGGGRVTGTISAAVTPGP